MFGGIDFLFNNAGTFVGGKPMEDLSESDWDVSCKVHITGVAEFCKLVIPSMKERGGGAIVNNSSALGWGGIANMAGYAATKFGTIGLTKCMADEYGQYNILVNTVCPGNTWTDISQGEIEYQANTLGIVETPEDAKKWQEESSPLGRYGTAKELAEAMVFLASPAASFITGATLRVDGGVKGLLT